MVRRGLCWLGDHPGVSYVLYPTARKEEALLLSSFVSGLSPIDVHVLYE